MLITFRPDDTAPYESLNEWSEGGGFGVFISIPSEDVGDDFWVCWDELNEFDKEPCQNVKNGTRGPRRKGSEREREGLRYRHTVVFIIDAYLHNEPSVNRFIKVAYRALRMPGHMFDESQSTRQEMEWNGET